ncbi:hypothetical protein GCM10027521_02830 [Amycolatopsis cihanbeyliensis]
MLNPPAASPSRPVAPSSPAQADRQTGAGRAEEDSGMDSNRPNRRSSRPSTAAAAATQSGIIASQRSVPGSGVA